MSTAKIFTFKFKFYTEILLFKETNYVSYQGNFNRGNFLRRFTQSNTFIIESREIIRDLRFVLSVGHPWFMGKVNALGDVNSTSHKQMCISGNYNYCMISDKICTKVNVEKLNLGLTDPSCLSIMIYNALYSTGLCYSLFISSNF